MAKAILYQNKFRIDSIRRDYYNYSTPGYYFVTICSKDKYKYFGVIVEDEFHENKLGKIVTKCWNEIPEHFPFVEIDICVVMPNHVHGILRIKNPVETQDLASLHMDENISLKDWKPNQFGPQSKNLGSIVRGFKIGVTKEINRIKGKGYFKWQSRYHDRIIRDDKELYLIREYITNNPLNWEKEKFY